MGKRRSFDAVMNEAEYRWGTATLYVNRKRSLKDTLLNTKQFTENEDGSLENEHGATINILDSKAAHPAGKGRKKEEPKPPSEPYDHEKEGL
jgi:hypothetical protein